jgi:uncharacterized membrane protein YedE/YeeE
VKIYVTLYRYAFLCTASAGVLASAFVIDVNPWLVILTDGALFGIGTGFAFIAPVACCVRVSSSGFKYIINVVAVGFS